MTKRNGKNMLMRYILRGDKEIYVGHFACILPTAFFFRHDFIRDTKRAKGIVKRKS